MRKLKHSVSKLSRQLNYPLTPKASRIMKRKPNPPGQHGGKKGRSGVSDYKRHLMEKQRLRAAFNIREGQMQNYVRKATRMRGNSADNLLKILSSRLDAVVLQGGLARTVFAARQYISHGHILVNGRRVDIPSFRVRAGEEVSVKESSRPLPTFMEVQEEMVGPEPSYLSRSRENFSVTLVHLPEREEVPVPIEIPLVIEHYSR